MKCHLSYTKNHQKNISYIKKTLFLWRKRMKRIKFIKRKKKKEYGERDKKMRKGSGDQHM